MGLVPPSLNWDEASLGYNAYSILKTGKDEWGRSFPLSFEAFGDYKLPGYIYIDVPFVAVLGLNEEGVRAPSQAAGVLTVLFIYLLVNELSKNKKLALLSSFLLAISPMAIFLSRVALEANLALCFFVVGVYFLIKGLNKQYWLILSSILLGLTLFTYNSARVFVPLFLIVTVFIFWKQFKTLKFRLVPAFLIFAGMFLLASYFAFFQDSSARYYWVRIVDQGAINYLNESRANSPLPQLLTKLVFNRYTYFVTNFIKNYLSHFSLEFLFLKGGTNYQFSIPNVGLMYLFELPFLIIGLYKSLKTKPLGWLALAWFLLAPIPSALTREAPQVLRSIFILGGAQIIVGFGLVVFVDELTKRFKLIKPSLAYGLLAVILLASLGAYLYQYFLVYPKNNSQSWQYGMKQAVDFIKNNPSYSNPQQTIYFSKAYGEPHIFYLFFDQYDPAKYQYSESLVRYSQTNWRWVDRLDNIYFLNDWEVQDKVKDKKGLLITTPNNYPKGATVLESVYFLNGSKAFDIVRL
jgi:4-amino-4-deoxy-L-arabinose transferase-like glycosyltransferase